MKRWPDSCEYAFCLQCGEYHDAALRFVDGRVLCFNCRSPGHHQWGRCSCCPGEDVPLEKHHIASHRQHATLITPVCLNCHAILSAKQRNWHSSWLSESHPLRFALQGWFDILAVRKARAPDMQNGNTLSLSSRDVLLLFVLFGLFGDWMHAFCKRLAEELSYIVIEKAACYA